MIPVSHCACLGEGVDVPVLDGVAFIDPKRSMIDIIQAVGRVIRQAAGQQLGTLVIPVLIDTSGRCRLPADIGVCHRLQSVAARPRGTSFSSRVSAGLRICFADGDTSSKKA